MGRKSWKLTSERNWPPFIFRQAQKSFSISVAKFSGDWGLEVRVAAEGKRLLVPKLKVTWWKGISYPGIIHVSVTVYFLAC